MEKLCTVASKRKKTYLQLDLLMRKKGQTIRASIKALKPMRAVKTVWLKIPAAIPVKQWYIYKCYLRSIDKSCINDDMNRSDILIENEDLTFYCDLAKQYWSSL